MSYDWTDIRVTPGAKAERRLPAPLVSEAPLLRPERLAECVAQLLETAPQPWRDMLRKEPAVVAAQILAFRPEDAITAYDLAVEQGHDALIRHVGNVARRLDDWLRRVATQLPDQFGQTLTSLDHEMQLQTRVAGLATATVPSMSEAFRQIFPADASARPGDPVAEARLELSRLSALHRQLVHAVASLQPTAATAFTDRLRAGGINPAVGLILAELSAAGLVDARLNRFTRRHTGFYYRDILGQAPAGAEPEKVLLHLPPVPVRKYLAEGTTLTARDGAGGTARFRTESDLPLTGARIRATGGITFETDPQISLFATLGAITGIRAAIDRPRDGPLGRGVFTAPDETPVDAGLDIASDMFRLREGRRQIEMRLEMRRATPLPAASVPCDPGDLKAPDPHVRLELQNDPELIDAFGFASMEEAVRTVERDVHELSLARGCTPSMSLIYETMARKTLGVAPLRQLLGRIVTLGLVEGQPWPTGDYWTVLRQRIDACAADLSGQRVTDDLQAHAFWHRPAEGNSILGEAFALDEAGTFIFTPEDVFQKFMADAFRVTLSTAEGWLTPDVLQILPNGPDRPPGLTLRLTLEPDAPSIVPPAETPGGAPVLALRFAPDARICPYSFFERYQLDSTAIRVKVEDLRTFAAFSDDGPLATDQSFLPFSSRPAEGSTLTIAAPEMAMKPVSRMTLRVTWEGLPRTAEGFAAQYRHYPKGTALPEPELTMSYLTGGRWKPLSDGPVALAGADPATGVYLAENCWTGELDSPSLPEEGAAAAVLPKARGDIRGGAIRLRLSGTADGFGQALYPQALARAMRPRLLPLGPRPLPKPPFVPRIAHLSLGYEAQCTIELSAPDSARPRERLVRVTPFGRLEIFPARTERHRGLFPRRLGYGTLLVQLAGPGAQQRLCLLFEIADSGHARLARPPVPLAWHYLTDDGWCPLPQTAISSDTTDGLMRSGVMTIDLPDNASAAAPEMPPGGPWLAVSATRRGFDSHPILSGVRTNGVWAVAEDGAAPLKPDADRVWAFDPGVPGVGRPVEVAHRAPPRPAEDMPAFRARVAERLRHRRRAVTPWDIERMALDAFPEIWRAKCLPHMVHDTPIPRPGVATLVAVRHPPKTATGPASAPRELLFDTGKLARIRDFLGRHASPFARFEVVNPAFDRLHVRAQVRFVDHRNDGALAFRLREHLSRQLSVWTAPDEISGFGWTLNVSLLRAQIAALDYVQDVTDFSVLHFISGDDGTYRLGDTAQDDGRGPHGPVIRPSRPWALALSARTHAIAATDYKLDIPATQSGIGRLMVGDMLVVGQETLP